MFEEFDPKAQRRDGRRMGASLLVSSIVYLGFAGGVIAASAAARQAVKEEELVQIEIAAPPEPKPPEPPPTPPPAATPPSPRPKVQRKALAAPTEVPKDKPAEADKPLAEAPADDGKDGFTDGVAGGTGTAPAPVATPPPAPSSAPVHMPENAKPPELIKGQSPSPPYPEEARKNGVSGVVFARVTISREGQVTKVEILKGPQIFHEVVKATLIKWRYEPARLPDGTPISVFRIVPLPFQLENM